MWQNSTSTTTKNFNIAATIFIQQIFHVPEEFHMTTLVTGDSNTLYIFFNSSFHYFFYTPVVPQMNDFNSFALHNTSHNIDGSIMAIKKRCCCYNPYFIL